MSIEVIIVIVAIAAFCIGVAVGFQRGWRVRDSNDDGWADEARWWRAQHEQLRADQATSMGRYIEIQPLASDTKIIFVERKVTAAEFAQRPTASGDRFFDVDTPQWLGRQLTVSVAPNGAFPLSCIGSLPRGPLGWLPRSSPGGP